MIVSLSFEELSACLDKVRQATLASQAPLVAAVEKLVAAVERSQLDAATLTRMGKAIDANTAAIVAAEKDDQPTIEKHFAKEKL